MSSERKSFRNHNSNEMIAALLSSNSISATARAMGVQETTIYRNLRKPAFKEQYAAAKRRLLDGAINKLQLASAGAVDVLVSIAGDESQPPASRVSAARSILDLAIRAGAVEALEARIEELESRTIVNVTPNEWGEHEQTVGPTEEARTDDTSSQCEVQDGWRSSL